MRHVALIHLAVSCILLIGIVSAYGMWYGQVGKASAEAAALAKAITEKSQESVRVAAAREALETLGADEAAIRSYRVEQQDIVAFLERLEGIGTGLGAHVEVVSVAADTKGDHPRITLSLKITGSFDAVVRTLGAIEFGPYDSTVQNVTLDASSGEGGKQWSAAATFAIGTSVPKP